VRTFAERLMAAGVLTPSEWGLWEQEVAAELAAAVAYADAGTIEPVEDLQRFVYAEETAG
jgi:TPP-dependent pyruvate/acetoin dehydrogenase alpha subunit